MAITIGERIQSAINHMDQNEIELGLSDTCIAVDITAQKYYKVEKSSADIYKKFLKENMWMIITTGMGNLISSSIKIPFKHDDIVSDDKGYCTLEQIVYHVMRCGLIHGTGENNKIKWNSSIPLAVDKEGFLNISPSFIWGLILSVVTCPVNKDEQVGELAWISTSSFKYLINDLWGKKESVVKMIKSAYGIDIIDY